MLGLTYAQIVTRLSEQVGQCPRTWGPCRAFMHACQLADLDPGEAAESLAVTRITRLGRHDFAVCPNDLQFVEAIRSDDPLAYDYLRAEARNRPIGHVCAVLRCSQIWVLGAVNRWGIYRRPKGQASKKEVPEETRLQSEHTPIGLSNLLTRQLKTYRNWPREAAWSLGVSQQWFSYKLRTLPKAHLDRTGATPEQLAAPAQPMTDLMSADRATKEKVRRRIIQLGSISLWAEEVGLTYNQARRQAALAGYQKRRPHNVSRSDGAIIAAWVQDTGYTGATNGVGSGWIAKNVLGREKSCKVSWRQVRYYMLKLGFVSKMRDRSSDRVWVRPEVDNTAPEFKQADSDRKPGPLDLAKRKALRAEIMSGKIPFPTPEQLDLAGLFLATKPGPG